VTDSSKPLRHSQEDAESDPSADQAYHRPKSVDQLTKRNVTTIAELEKAAQANQTVGDIVADRITRFCGSMTFVWVHVLWFTAWILGNTVFAEKPIDPYPFSFLTLVVSLEAIFLSTFIMISENRQGRLDERRSHLDLQINLLAEQENTKMLALLKRSPAKWEFPKKIQTSKCSNRQLSRKS
jgi:uncharacterized membrane protein